MGNLETPRARYRQVADELRAAIKRGEFPPGSMLPSQPELARRYGLNQTSINRAIATLRAEGLIRTEHGAGSYVLDVPKVKRVRKIDRDYRTSPEGSSYAEELRRVGVRPENELVEVGAVIPPSDIAEALGLDEAGEAVIRRRHMFADGKPVQVATSYIPMDVAGSVDIATPDTGPSGMFARLADRGFGPVRFTEDIEVRPPTTDEATFFKIPENYQVFSLLRTAYTDDDRPVEACLNVLVAAQWRLSYSWRQDG